MKVAVLGKDGKTGKAVIERLQSVSDHQYVEEIEKADLLVVSPGIPPAEYPLVKIPIISEIELAYRLNPSPVVAITGTNGKSTTTTLIGLLLGVPAVGNIGIPYISVEEKHPYLSVEVSSYQLENIKTFKPFISVILNITEDHLSWHGGMENYVLAKKKIFQNQTEQDHLIYNQDDHYLQEIVKDARCQLHGFSAKGIQQDYAAARIAAKICGKTDEEIDSVFKNFKGVEHRFELVGEFDGIRVINDSKATNVDSTVVALENEAKNNHIILIAGGRDKNTPLEPMAAAMRGRVKKLILLGEAQARFAAGLKEFDQILVNNYEAAVKESVRLAKKGDLILLSPACASWDMFANFEERGRIFKALIKEAFTQI